MNYGQLPVNAPVAPVANFQRDGFMAIDNQGTRPNYQSSLVPLTYKAKPYEQVKHESWLGHANVDLSFITERKCPLCLYHVERRPGLCCCVVDFEQPRALWQKVFSDVDRDHFVGNVAGHLKNAKSAEVKARQRTFDISFPFISIWMGVLTCLLACSVGVRCC